MQLSKFLLFPFTVVYSLIILIRNKSYDLNLRKSVSFETNVVVVGNLEVGGTGKTPMIHYIIELLSNSYKLSVLSRGYKRRSKGFILASKDDTPEALGDESYLTYSKYGDNVSVAVDKVRETAIPFILANQPETDIILMDDGFQYRTVNPSLSILLTRYGRLFTKDLLLPSGRLREHRSGATRADIIIVTKCPAELAKEEQTSISSAISDYSKAKIYFATEVYGDYKSFTGKELSENVLLVTGIAHTDSLVEHIRSTSNLVKHLKYEDHHEYQASDFERIREECNKHESISILTTEKDATKWDPQKLSDLSIYTITHAVSFLADGALFEEQLVQSIKDYELPY